MSSSDSGMNDNSKGFSDGATSRDGYGGFTKDIYDAILAFKKRSIFPSFCNETQKRNANFHWRTRCKNFSVSSGGLLVYSPNPSISRAVVRVGEVRHVIRFIHEKIGHMGQKQTIHVCARRVYWRSMRRDVAHYVANCEECRNRREARRSHFQMAASSSAHCSSSQVEDDDDMAQVVHRLMLANEGGSLADEAGYGYGQEEEEENAYDVMYDQPYHHHLAGMDVLLDDGEERDVAATLSSMNASYFAMQQRPQIKIEHTDHHSSSGDVYDEDDEDTMPMIVSDDVIPAASNEIVTTMMSPASSYHNHRRHPQSSLNGRRAATAVMMGRVAGGGGGRAQQGGTRKRRLANTMQPRQLFPGRGNGVAAPCTSNSTKKQLMAENEALRGRLRMLEQQQQQGGVGGGSDVMQMPPMDEETAGLQKSLLHMQREVLMLQRAYWQAKLHREGFDVLDDGYYVEASAAEEEELVEEVEEGGDEDTQMSHHHYKEEEEDEELEELRVIEEALSAP